MASVLCGALFLAWMFVPDFLLLTWGVGYTDAAGFVGRRSAALFLGISLMLARMRTFPPSANRTALADGFALTCGVLAALGFYEAWVGHAGPGIFSAIAVEILTAWGLASSVRTAVE